MCIYIKLISTQIKLLGLNTISIRIKTKARSGEPIVMTVHFSVSQTPNDLRKSLVNLKKLY